jgi:MerR family transcriptional regulator, light-induced transcriptional regulator
MNSFERILKTREVAKVLGVSPSTVKRWVDSGALPAARTVGKHRLVKVSEALDLARRYSLPCRDPAVDSEAEPTDPKALLKRCSEELAVSLIEGNEAQARSLILSFYSRFKHVSKLADELIAPVMKRIGRDWASGNLDVHQEHLATRIVECVLLELVKSARFANLESFDSRPKPLAIGAAPGASPYTLAGLFCELILLETGWSVRNFGCNLPFSSLDAAVVEYKPKLVWISVNYIEETNTFIREYEKFQQAASRLNCSVAIGGQALGSDLRTQMVYTSFGDRMVHFSEFVKRLGQSTPGSSSTTSKDRPVPA